MKAKITQKSEKEILAIYPIKSKIQGWFFKVTEISNNAYEAEGTDLFGRLVSKQGNDPEQLLVLCEQDIQKIE